MEKKRRFAVIGLGAFGSTLARALTERGAEVIGVEKKASLVEELRDALTLVVQLDSTDEEALKSQGIHEVDVAVVSIGEDFAASVLTTALLKRLGVPTVIARASPSSSRLQEKILKLVGADKVVLPEVEMGKKLAQTLMVPHIIDYIPVSERYGAAEIEAPPSFWGKSIGELKVRQKYGVNVLEIKKAPSPNGKRKINYLPQAKDVVEKGDTLLVIGREEDIEKIGRGE